MSSAYITRWVMSSFLRFTISRCDLSLINSARPKSLSFGKHLLTNDANVIVPWMQVFNNGTKTRLNGFIFFSFVWKKRNRFYYFGGGADGELWWFDSAGVGWTWKTVLIFGTITTLAIFAPFSIYILSAARKVIWVWLFATHADFDAWRNFFCSPPWNFRAKKSQNESNIGKHPVRRFLWLPVRRRWWGDEKTEKKTSAASDYRRRRIENIGNGCFVLRSWALQICRFFTSRWALIWIRTTSRRATTSTSNAKWTQTRGRTKFSGSTT